MDQRHISEAELGELWFSDTAATEEENAARQKVLAHCEECSTCNDRLTSYLEAEREINSLSRRSNDNQEGHFHCPDEGMWLKLAADVLEQGEAIRLVRHASTCGHCAGRLSTAQKYLVEDIEEVPDRATASPKWQAKVAQKMARHSPPLPPAKIQLSERHRVLRSWFFWVPLTAAVCVISVIVVLSIGGDRHQDVEKLLGQAYGESRTIEPRFAQALYGQLQIERGPNSQSRTSKPPTLLKAEESLSRYLRAESHDPIWLDLKGRADLLDGNYAEALKSLETALQIQPDSIAILTDTAIAYFEVAEIADRPEDYGKAIDLLSKVLRKKPDDAVALYNRALVDEKMFLFPQAIEDWEHYLRIDSHGEWAEDAKHRLDALHKKLADHEKSAGEPLLQPRDFIDETSLNRNDQRRELITAKAEQYLDRAIQEWLPAAFSSAGTAFSPTISNSRGRFVRASSLSPKGNSSHAAQAAFLATRMLSDVLITDHGDNWLSDLLRASQSIAFPAALHALQEAVYASSVGNFAAARSKATDATRFFRQARSVAGEMRARYETIYAMERSFQEKDRCLMAAAPIESKLRHYHYPWIRVQLYLEQSNCWAQVGNFGRAYQYVEDALALVERSKYPTLYLRALGMAAALYSRQGNREKAYSLDRTGLANYWEGCFPPIRAYQFYSDLDTLAEENTEWNFALLLAQEAVRVIRAANQALAEAFAHHRLAKIALIADDRPLATREFDQANRLFKVLPQTKETWAYEADAEIELAKLQAAYGDEKGAWAHLSTAGTHISQISHYSIALSYYKTVADLQRLNHKSNEAVGSLWSAVVVAEKGLGSLRNEDERLLWTRETEQTYRDLAESIWRLGNIEGALEIWERYRGASIRSVPGPGKRYSSDFENPLALPSDEFRRQLATLSAQTTISYLQVSGGLIIWVLDNGRIATQWVTIPQQDINRLASRFRDECADRNSDLAALRQHARDLYNLLIAPIADHLSADRTIVIEPYDSGVDIPISALIDPAGHYLSENYSIVISPGLLYQRHLRYSETPSAKDRALIIGSPAQDLGAAVLDPLNNADEEARYVAARFHSTPVLGGQATLDKVLTELTRAAVFHYAGHGLTVQGKVGLLLAPSKSDGSEFSQPLLDATTIMAVKLDRLKLAVFSACLTAGEGEDNLESPGNLVRLFLRSGVPHVVASQWNVNSSTTIDFMQTFYDGVLTGSSVPVSVRNAANKLRRQSITSHPYYWAAFTAFGI